MSKQKIPLLKKKKERNGKRFQVFLLPQLTAAPPSFFAESCPIGITTSHSFGCAILNDERQTRRFVMYGTRAGAFKPCRGDITVSLKNTTCKVRFILGWKPLKEGLYVYLFWGIPPSLPEVTDFLHFTPRSGWNRGEPSLEEAVLHIAKGIPWFITGATGALRAKHSFNQRSSFWRKKQTNRWPEPFAFIYPAFVQKAGWTTTGSSQLWGEIRIQTDVSALMARESEVHSRQRFSGDLTALFADAPHQASIRLDTGSFSFLVSLAQIPPLFPHTPTLPPSQL